ncbi:STE50 [Candida theae]|uniref:STE50 n=1 Tax=Candida theae TaxID=1198502 RepID=A0AAD5BB80_9ASCO|nr:STE50 [Candida theae]KAI5949472.1 STE50 [Candida theae]
MNTPSFNDSFLKWDPAQVSTFINTVTKDQNRQYGSFFLDNNIDGSLLPSLSTEHLKELGIDTLKVRLKIKKSISDLIVDHYKKHPPQSIYDPEYALNNINIDSSQISLESLKVSAVLVQDSIRKFNREVRGQQVDSPVSPTQQEIKRLNDNFRKLKTDLIPVIRLLKDSKPLPTPTLDPGPAATMESPTFSLSHSVDEREKTEARPNSGHGVADANRFSTAEAHSPTSHRFSTGSLLSMGTGQIISQLVSKVVDDQSHDFRLQKVGKKGKGPLHGGLSNISKPELVENKSYGSTVTVNTDQQKPQSQAPSVAQLRSPFYQTQSAAGSHQPIQAQQQHLHPQPHSQPQPNTAQPQPNTAQPHSSRSHSSNEPLKQLRASTDDSCMKVLQHAMKRHHIPREDWSKYVLVICYGDKERILKLAEKPVVVYKELQELGKHPAIMLRQLADVSSSDPEDYEDSRISSDIPGGVL